MDTALLTTKFTRIGARLKLADRTDQHARTVGAVSLDVWADRLGKFFEIALQSDAVAKVVVLDVQPADRHLLMVREPGEKSKFLCGHDERHWFVAGIHEAAPVGTVRQAKEALKPAAVVSAQAAMRLRGRRPEPAEECRLRPTR